MKCRKLNLFPCIDYSLRKFNSRAVPFSPCSGQRVLSGSASFCWRMGCPGFAGTRDAPAFPPKLNPPFPRILEMIEFPALLTAVFSKSESRLDTKIKCPASWDASADPPSMMRFPFQVPGPCWVAVYVLVCAARFAFWGIFLFVLENLKKCIAELFNVLYSDKI